MSRSRVRCALLSLFCLATGPLAVAQSVVLRGGEFQVNTYTPNFQLTPSVALDADGGFVVVWVSEYQDGDDNGIFARRFDPDGAPLASEFQVNSYTTGDQRYSAISMQADGDFVVAWTSKGQDGSDYGIFARRFDSTGSAQGAEFRVNTYTNDVQNYPAVARDGDDDFVVAWSSTHQDGDNTGIFAQRFDAAGTPQGAEFQVNTRTALSQNRPALAVDSDGDFVVAWSSSSQEGNSYGVFARRFDSAGTAQASEFQVNVYTPSSQNDPDVAMDADGDFVVAWKSYGQDGSFYGVFARRFDASGAPQGSEFQVNAHTSLSQRRPTVALDDDGELVVTWPSDGQDGSNYGIFARRFDAAGTPQASELQVNAYTTAFQRSPAIGTDGAGDFVIAWESDQDGDSRGIFARRLGPPVVLDVDGDGLVGALTDGLLVLRFLFDFTGATLTTGAVDDDCSRCDAMEIGDYLDTLI